MKVLVAEDSSTMRHILVKCLNSMGFNEIRQFGDGESAVEWLDGSNEKPGLILLDWNMPKMNGFQVLQHVRSQASTKSIPIIMVTTESEKDSVIKALSAGANDYLTKPIDMDRLLAMIRVWLGRAA